MLVFVLSGKRFNCGRVQHILQVGVSESPFYHNNAHAHIVLVTMVKSCDTGMAPRATASITRMRTRTALYSGPARPHRSCAREWS